MSDPTNPLPSFLQMIVGALARHFLTTLAGSLATVCGLSHDQQVQFVTGGGAVIVWLVGVLWSMAQKKTVASSLPQPLPADLPPT